MKHDEQFDELARRKLAERSFPFEEAHWLAAEEAIHTGGKRNSRKGLWYGGAALLLLLAGLWWWAPQAGVPEAEHAATQAEAAPATHGTSPIAEALPPPTGTAKEHEGTIAEEAPPSVPAGTSKGAMANATRTSNADRSMPYEARTSGTHATTATPIAITANDEQQEPAPMVHDQRDAEVAEVIERPIADAEEEIPQPAPPVMGTVPASDAPALASAAASENSAAISQEVDEEPAITTASASNDVPDAPMVVEGTTDAPATETPTTIIADVSGTLATEATESTQMTPGAAPREEDGSTTPIAQEAAGEEELLLAIAPEAAAPQDSLGEAMDPLTFPPLVPHGSPWEVSLLGGVQWNRVHYPGEDIGERGAVSEQMTSPAYGVELMRMGRNFGLGLGLHYSSYDERMISGERTRDLTSLDRFWFLTPVDTTILVITDTVDISGQPYYTGVSTETTINVLTQGTDTVTSTVVDREARNVINRVSYFEVPLLLDAHLVQGRWSIGVRGGPTLGLLSGRRGSVPNGAQDGYTDLNDKAFRELMIGYQVRTYIRYRFNAGWSVGVEPMLRGQFGNGLEGGDLARRSSAMGGLLSLTYRLR
jgi:hypothetical protein